MQSCCLYSVAIQLSKQRLASLLGFSRAAERMWLSLYTAQIAGFLRHYDSNYDSSHSCDRAMVLRTRGTRRGSVGRRQQQRSIDLYAVVIQLQRPRHCRRTLRVPQPAATHVTCCQILTCYQVWHDGSMPVYIPAALRMFSYLQQAPLSYRVAQLFPMVCFPLVPLFSSPRFLSNPGARKAGT